MWRKNKLVCLAAILFFHLCSIAQNPAPYYIFKNGKEGYRMYRIPTVITAINGTLLAFCEGRQSLFDLGDIDVVMKTSTDGGKTWSPLKVIWNDGKNTCGNPSAVIDIVSGDIVLLATLNNGQVMVMRSSDGGSHWTGPKDITNNVKPANWLWYATGPVHGIQLEHSRWRNRLV